MADTSNVKILDASNDLFNLQYLTISSSTVIAPGDLITCGSGAATAYSGTPAGFFGVSKDLSRSGDTKNIGVFIRSVCTIGVASDTYAHGNDLAYSAGANGTDWTLADAVAGENAIAWSMQYKATAVTTLTVLIDGEQVGKAVADKGLWNTSTDAA